MENKFVHLHVHSHYSILDGMSKVPDLIDKCLRTGMNAMALTDHGNMFGIKELTDYAIKVNKKTKGAIGEQQAILDNPESTDEAKAAATEEIAKLKNKIFKPIIGCECYCARRKHTDHDNTFRIDEAGKSIIADSSGWHLILIAKNKHGYQNLCKIVSKAWVDGYYNRPRIDKDLLVQYHEDLIVCSACLGGELPKKIMSDDLEGAEATAKWFKNLFGDDYYIEIQRHKTDKPNGNTSVYEAEQRVNPQLVAIAQKLGIKVVCTNDVHFVEEEHSEAHERLVCLSTGKLLSDPQRMTYTKQEWLKTPDEMAEIFSDIPDALENTLEVADKVEVYSIESDPIMPKFPIPEDFGTEEEYRQRITEKELFDEFTQDENHNVVLSQEDAEKKIKKLGGYDKLYRIKLEADYLNKLAWEGAHMRYGENLTEEQTERIVFELHIMKTMGFPGYFLIVMDYIRAAREELGVSVGPGRGSAAGSVVAYCLKITDVDPLKYDLLFERFLNPDRISLPDIDVDFDDDGRGKVLDWVTEKYGKEKVAHIITYGTMATKSSIADVARVQDVPLSLSNQMKKWVPDAFDDSLADPKTGKVPKVNLKNCFKYVPEMRDALEGNDEQIKSTLIYASQLENTIRQTGIHACGVIIGAGDLTNWAPISTVEDKETKTKVMVTQYDGHVIESVGLIKMDFLGLKTLSIIKEALKNIKKSHGIDLDIDKIPIDDKETYELYSRGDTIGTFQFESAGMQKYLRELQPTVFEDLIAMNALYRPGPLQYIPKFINRKLGKEKIEYDIPCMEKYLKDTYGVTVYQEQVMLLSRQLANFTRGESDALRKAMGKKLIEKMNELKAKFMKQGVENGHDANTLDKIWRDWEEFAKYAFNKSHATCYSWVAYQTAYLKAHYPADYMAANLTRSMDKIEDVRKFMDECKRMGIEVLSPDVNESDSFFSTNANGNIRFGLQGIKGMSRAVVEELIAEREKNGKYTDIYDFVSRVNCGAKDLECLAMSGAFDSLKGIEREHFFESNNKEIQFSVVLADFGKKVKLANSQSRNSLFDDMEVSQSIALPPLPKFEKWTALDRLQKEKDLVGIYLSAHPLDDYYILLKYICNTRVTELEDIEKIQGRSKITAGGIITSITHKTSQKGTPGVILKIEDYSGAKEIALWGRDVGMVNYLQVNNCVVFSATIAPDRYRPDMVRITYNDFKLMSEAKEALKMHLNLILEDKSLTEDFIKGVSQYMQPDENGATFNIDLVHTSEGTHSRLDFKTMHRILITRQLMDFLEEYRKKAATSASTTVATEDIVDDDVPVPEVIADGDGEVVEEEESDVPIHSGLDFKLTGDMFAKAG